MATRAVRSWLRERPGVLVCALVLALSVATVYDQFRGLIPVSPGANPHTFVEQNQVARNRGVLRGEGGDPWKYRVASEWLASQARRIARAAGFHEPAVAGFLAFRVLQNAAIFGLAWLLYRRLGLSRYASVLGLGLIAWAMTQALLHSGLAFDTYGDVVVYLAAALLILSRRYAWVVPLAAIGALNRDTSGLVPIVLIAWAVPMGLRTPEGRRVVRLGLAALAAFAATTVALRVAAGPGDLILPYGRHPGWQLFEYNFGRGQTWDQLFRTLTVLPLLALWSFRRWPLSLRVLGVALVPAWLTIHAFGAVLQETRLLLVPYVLILVPGALIGLVEGESQAPENSVVRHPADSCA
jgi:hypothetical protein